MRRTAHVFRPDIYHHKGIELKNDMIFRMENLVQHGTSNKFIWRTMFNETIIVWIFAQLSLDSMSLDLRRWDAMRKHSSQPLAFLYVQLSLNNMTLLCESILLSLSFYNFHLYIYIYTYIHACCINITIFSKMHILPCCSPTNSWRCWNKSSDILTMGLISGWMGFVCPHTSSRRCCKSSQPLTYERT